MKGNKTLTMPHPLKPRVLLWADLSYSDMEEVEAAQSTERLQSVLARVLGLRVSEPRDGVLVDLYLYAVLFCRGRGFNREQTATLLSIIRAVHLANTETPLNNIEHCFSYCTELILCHCVRRPPFSIDLYSPEEATQVTEYLVNSYFRHYSLYKYTFTPQVRLDLSLSYTGMVDPDATDSASQMAAPKADGARETEAERERGMDTDAERQTEQPLGTSAHSPSPRAELRQLVQSELSVELGRVQAALE
ncbi:cilia- and flagella-associated protein 119 [Amia ocellicauda]|uniref:cilia- and flagella-associated protein 119 n=1 Tax=Amia ocellicauda TaxID=2972642 RepID=UPI003464BBDF